MLAANTDHFAYMQRVNKEIGNTRRYVNHLYPKHKTQPERPIYRLWLGKRGSTAFFRSLDDSVSRVRCRFSKLLDLLFYLSVLWFV